MTQRSEPRVVPIFDAMTPPSADRVSCGRCGKTFCDGAVFTPWDDPTAITWSDAGQCFTVPRTLYCDHCDHLVTWQEGLASLSTGPIGRDLLTGVVIAGPGYIRDQRKIAAFLIDHPECKGVEQS